MGGIGDWVRNQGDTVNTVFPFANPMNVVNQVGDFLSGPDIPPPPGMSQAELDYYKALTTQITQLIGTNNASAELQKALMPYIFDSMGYTYTAGKEGGAPTITKKPISESDQLAQQIQLEANKYALNAIQGKLPVSPALESDLTRQGQQLNTSLQKQLGPGYATSTPGIQAQAEKSRNDASIREAVRSGELTNLNAIGMSREAQNRGLSNNAFAMLSGSYSPIQQAAAGNVQAAGAMAPIAQGYANQAQQRYQYDLANYQQKLNNRNALLQLGTQVGIGALTGGAGLLGPGVGAGAGAGLGLLSPGSIGSLYASQYFRQPQNPYQPIPNYSG